MTHILLSPHRRDDSVIYEAIPNPVTHNTIHGNGSTINSSPSPVPVGPAPPRPPSSSLAMGSSNASPSLTMHDPNYSKIGSETYSVPHSPVVVTSRRSDGFHVSRNESYGSLPSPPLPHYATPTSTLQHLPEVHANIPTHLDTDAYEPVKLLPGTQ